MGEGVSICFICKDALSIYREVTARGIKASRPFVGNGMWVTSLSDPDGYRIDFESETDVPEDTEFYQITKTFRNWTNPASQVRNPEISD